MKNSYFIATILLLFSCKGNNESKLESFNQELAQAYCDTAKYCCTEHNLPGSYNFLSYDYCVQENLERFKNTFNENNFAIDESKLDYILEEYKKIHNGDCFQSYSNKVRKELDQVFLSGFTPMLDIGDRCNSDLPCKNSSCNYDPEFEKFFCSYYRGEGENCNNTLFPCSEELTCIYDGVGDACYELKSGDNCINGSCGTNGQYTCDASSQKCVDAMEVGDECEKDKDCESLICDEGFCAEYTMLDYHCYEAK